MLKLYSAEKTTKKAHCIQCALIVKSQHIVVIGGVDKVQIELKMNKKLLLKFY